MLIRSLLIRLISAYSVVLLPEPVGPDVRIIPFGRFSPASTVRSARPVIPIPSISIVVPLLSSNRITTCSPHTTGEIAIRRSTSLSPTITANCPSCGIRCSSIFKFAKIFTRDTSAGSIVFGSSITRLSTPSIRHLITSAFSSGSMCTSDALLRTAKSKILVSALEIGESCVIVLTLLLAACRCATSSSVAFTACSTPVKSPLYCFKTAWIPSDDAITARTGRPVKVAR